MNLISQITRWLSPAYPIGEARALARIVLEDGFGLSQTDVLMGKDKDLSAESLTQLQNIVQRLLRHEPVQYVLGTAWFCGRRFHVCPGCLIPRPETEDLVELILRDFIEKNEPIRLLDVGTGSGCIAISLALALEQRASVSALDISSDALDIARENAQHLGAEVRFMQHDILNMPAGDEQWHTIVSNPPYVRECEAAQMQPNVLEHEPHLALFVPDNDALRFYRAIADYAWEHLHTGGWLYFEINRYLSREIAEMLENRGFIAAEVVNDRFENPRIIKCQRP